MSDRKFSLANYLDRQVDPAIDAGSNPIALLLAGGDGVRLRELTRRIAGAPIPKQYCRLLNGASLLEASISRALLLFPPDRIHVILNHDHLDLARDQVKALPVSNLLVQPMNRDTGPGITYALLHLARSCNDATVAVFPTDHYIDNGRAFVAHVMRAMVSVQLHPEKILILGVAPDRPDTGYGYIMPSRSLTPSGTSYHVESFMEKPSLAEAQEIISRGGMWNTFVMVFRLSRMLELLHALVPEDVVMLCRMLEKPSGAVDGYHEIRPWNFSTQILARIPQHLIVLKVTNVSWSDWGTPESIERTYEELNLAPFWEMAKADGSRGQNRELASDLPNAGERQIYAVPPSR